MATNGSASGSASWVSATLTVSKNGHSVEGNYTSMHYKLSIYRQYNISSSASKYYSVSVNGSTAASGYTTIGGSGTKVITEGDVNVYHNTDGSKWLDFSFSQQFDVSLSSWVGTLSGSGGYWIDDIPRASNPSGDDPDNWYWYGANMVIYTNRASSSFTHTLRYNWNGNTGTIATGVGASYTWTIPKAFMNYIPNDTYTPGTIYCDTYNGATFIGTKSFTIYTVMLASDVNPTITSVNHSEANAVVSTAIGAYVQGKSKLKISLSGVSPKYGATITGYSISFDGSLYSVAAPTTGVVKDSGSLTITATITDSRGLQATKTATVTILAYSPPMVSKLQLDRANSNGTLNQIGTYIKTTRSGSASSLKVSTVEKNTLTYTIKTTKIVELILCRWEELNLRPWAYESHALTN